MPQPYRRSPEDHPSSRNPYAGAGASRPRSSAGQAPREDAARYASRDPYASREVYRDRDGAYPGSPRDRQRSRAAATPREQVEHRPERAANSPRALRERAQAQGTGRAAYTPYQSSSRERVQAPEDVRYPRAADAARAAGARASSPAQRGTQPARREGARGNAARGADAPSPAYPQRPAATRPSAAGTRAYGERAGARRSGAEGGAAAPARPSARQGRPARDGVAPDQQLSRTQRAEGRTRTARGERAADARGAARSSRTGASATAATKPERKKSRYIPSLDGLRSFAVLAVIVYHMGFTWGQGGLLGVTVFFVLSGYLITGLLIAEWDSTRTIDLKDFWLRRVRRIVPAIVLTVVGVAALCVIFNHALLTKMRPDILPSLFFFNNWWQIFHNVSYFEALGAPSPLSHFWSLAIEEQFYLIWPVALLIAFKLGAKKKWIRRATLVLAVASIAAMALIFDPAADPSRVYYGTDTRAFSLLIGAWLAFVWPSSRFEESSGEQMSGGERAVLDGIGIAALAGLIVMVALTNGFSPFLYRGGLVLISVLTALVIAVIVHPKSVLAKALGCAPLVWIGKRSYGMYLWHYPILLLTTPGNVNGDPNPLLCLVQLVIIFVVSALSFKFVEDPIRKGAIGKYLAKMAAGEARIGISLRRRFVPALGAFALVAVAVGGVIFVPETSAVEGADLMKNPAAAETPYQQSTKLDVSQLPLVGNRKVSEGKPVEMPEPRPARYDVLLIGDSVSVRAIPYFQEAFPNGCIDSAVNRQFYTGQEVYDYYKAEGLVGPNVIFALGTNGVATDADIDALVADVGPNKNIYFINTRSPQDWVATTNDALYRATERHENVHLIDWYSLSAGRGDLFDGDGTHLNEYGAQVYVDMIKAALGR